MTPDEAMRRIDATLSHVWMVRHFLKHCDEAQDDDELLAVPRALYDAMLALGPAWQQRDATAYLRVARKKLGKLRRAAADFERLQADVSTHTNFQMAVRSLNEAVSRVETLLDRVQMETEEHGGTQEGDHPL